MDTLRRRPDKLTKPDPNFPNKTPSYLFKNIFYSGFSFIPVPVITAE